MLLRYHIPQICVALHHIIGNCGVRDGGKVTASTFNLHAFSTAVIQNFVISVAFGFGYEIDVFDVGAILEHYCPVGIIVSGRIADVETAGQFCIDYNFILMFKRLGEVHFNALRIYHYEVVEGFL